MSASPKSPRRALILSLCVPGLGQFYNGDWLKGGLFLVASLAVTELALSGISLDSMLDGIPPEQVRQLGVRLLLSIGFLLWCAYDAWRCARAKLSKQPDPAG